MNIIRYLQIKNARDNAHFRLIDGIGYFVVNDLLVPEKEYLSAYPLPIHVRPDSPFSKGMNSDGTKHWMYED